MWRLIYLLLFFYRIINYSWLFCRIISRVRNKNRATLCIRRCAAPIVGSLQSRWRRSPSNAEQDRARPSRTRISRREVPSCDCSFVVRVVSFFRFFAHPHRDCPRCVSRVSTHTVRDWTNDSASACLSSAARASPERNRRRVTPRAPTYGCVARLPLLCCLTLVPVCSTRRHEHGVRPVRLSQLVTSHYRSPARNEVSAPGCILVDQSRREGETTEGWRDGRDVVEEPLVDGTNR